MAPKLEYLFKNLRRERAPTLGFAHSEAAAGEKMIVAAVVNSAKLPAISSAVSAGAKIVLIHGDPKRIQVRRRAWSKRPARRSLA